MLPLSRHGLKEMLLGTLVLAAIGGLLGWLFWPLSLIVLPVWIWLLAFFRDPERPIPQAANVMVSPADGTVSDINEIENSDLVGGPAVRVGIFLSVFNVHINRSPCAGKVTRKFYQKGKFLSALKHSEASAENEANTVVLSDPASGQPLAAVKQIAGLIARRIICTANESDALERGQRIGLIKFGSRTELTIPKRLSPRIKVQVGQKVRGAADIIAEVSW